MFLIRPLIYGLLEYIFKDSFNGETQPSIICKTTDTEKKEGSDGEKTLGTLYNLLHGTS